MSTRSRGIFHSDIQKRPFWWEAYEPKGYEVKDVPKEIPVAILGAGYTGLAAALELRKAGIESCVLESNEPGYGASTRSGGIVAGCGGIKTPLVNAQYSTERFSAILAATTDGFNLVERLITDENIKCEWHRTGLYKAANTKTHYQILAKKFDVLQQHDNVTTTLVPVEQQREQIGSDYYRGGMLTEEAAHLHPALYYKGLLNACEKRGIKICAHAEVIDLKENNNHWLVRTKRGDLQADKIIVATNGYTGDVTSGLKRRMLPLKPYIIATEVLPDDMADNLSPNNRSIVESSRIAAFYRLSGDKGDQRMIFGSRVKWRDIEPDEMAPYLYDIMLKRYPQLNGTRITHAWSGNVALTLDEQHHAGKLNGLYYALGCNGSGVANMTYLGTQIARKVTTTENYSCPFDTDDFPDNKYYNGNQRWFIPLIGGFFQFRDWIDRKLDQV